VVVSLGLSLSLVLSQMVAHTLLRVVRRAIDCCSS
jgi:hypothetical protein